MENKIEQLKKELKKEREKALDNANSEEEIIELWKQDKRQGIPNNKKQLFCAGCRNNEYNFGLGGAKQCWSLKSAKLKEMDIYPSLNSVEKIKMIKLSCYEKRYN